MFRLDHVGIAVESLDGATAVLGPLLGAEPTAVEEVDGQLVRVQFLGDGDGKLELLEATSPDSPIARHIQRRGIGLHHLAFRVTDLSAELRRLEAAGYQLVDREPRRGAGGHRVAFLHPRSTAGVLIELVQTD
jgi:methylmalonyl-CoA/ethylmalonyl-CoA epimerase